MKNLRLPFSLLLFFLLGSCTGEVQSQAPFQNLDSPQFKQMMEEKEVVVLDVRTPGEAAGGVLENAVLIDISKPDFMQKVDQLDKSATYLVYCRSGNRSVTACNAMSNLGFKKLYNLKGGIIDWKRNQLPTTNLDN